MALKSIIFTAVFLSGVVLCQAQSSAIDRYYSEYEADDRFTQITVSSRMFGLFVNFEMDDPDEQELVQAISKLKGLKMLVGTDIPEAASIYKKIVKEPADKMDELMSIDDSNTKFRFYITEAGGHISELLMCGFDSNKLLILSLVGEIDLKQIAALSKKMNIDGFEHFENVDQ